MVVPTQLVSAGKRFHRVNFWTQDVPATGYKVYLLRPAKERLRPPPAGATAFEKFLLPDRVRPVDGAMQSIYDKQLRREMVDASSPYRFGQYST